MDRLSDLAKTVTRTGEALRGLSIQLETETAPAANPEALALPYIAHEWKVNSRERGRVVLDIYKDRHVIDVRRWFVDGDGNVKPTTKGLTLDTRHAPDLLHGLVEACTIGVRFGIVPPLGMEGGGS